MGFRAVAYVDDGQCKLVSRKGNTYRAFSDLKESIEAGLDVGAAVLDGELCCLDDEGGSRCYDLMFHRAPAYSYAFDLLWLDGKDLCPLPLVERKEILRSIVPPQPSRLLYLDQIGERGCALFEEICGRDLEGIVAKPAQSPYRTERPLWVKIKNPSYSQAEGRRELFHPRGRS